MSERIKILITYRGLSEKHIQQIREASSRIVITVAAEKEDIESVEDAEIIFGPFDRETLLQAKRLKWVQVPSAGVDRTMSPDFIGSEVVLTSSSGIHRTPMSEIAVAMMLMLAKRLHKFMRFQLERRWERIVPDELAGKTLGILGLGNVGMETAWKAKCLGMKVLALDRQRRMRRPTYVDRLVGPEDLDFLLSESDYLVVAVPLTKETYHMIAERELRLLKPSAHVINIARGAVVDNNALVKALKEGWIAGAGLDVFEEEPLPKDSPFWELENVIITPHIGGAMPQYEDRAVEIFCENLRRYLANRPLLNEIDKEAGY